MAFIGLNPIVSAQTQPAYDPSIPLSQRAADTLPDAPVPQIELAASVDPQSSQAQGSQQPAANNSSAQAASSQSSPQQAPASDPPATGTAGGVKNGVTQNCPPSQGSSGSQNSSSSQSSAQRPCGQQTKQQKQQQEVNEQEHQRVLGIAPNFNLTYRHDAVSLTAAQKIDLAFHTSVDPFTFAAAFFVAGYHEALDEDTGFGWGAEGYFKRSGAAYLDSVDGAMIGNGFLPALLHQDPRYFRMGPGHSTMHRILYAAATNFVCKGDNGRWQPNISNVGGNIIAGALSNLYYPSQNSGWGQTIGNGMIVTTEGGFGSLFDEFWPDISRKVLHKDPTRGLDAQQAAAENSKKHSGSGTTSNSDNPAPQ